jgi:2-phospho-L-lactate/phosphoenolpyruvate guanylyltransferase
VHWTIIVPLKALPAAKSRLAAASPDPQQHANLVEAIRADTLETARAVGRVLIVVDAPAGGRPAGPADPADELVLVQVGDGLNQAVREAGALAARRWPDDGVAALVGDLPALRPDELQAALMLAAATAHAFVPDSAGTGTTLLTAGPGVDLDPAFGPGSAERHAGFAARLPAGPGLRLDVDTAADLEQARVLGVGPATRAALNW